MRALLIGAGAVGQVYGRHLQLGGAEVSYFVRPKYIAELEAGVDVYPLNGGHREQAIALTGFGLVAHADEVAAQTWDQVWLCISSPALRGPWLEELLGAIGDATLVALTPGLEDRATLLEGGRVSEAQLVTGQITFTAWQAPLPGQQLPTPGVAYWFPPASPSVFSGPPARVAAVVSALKAGRCPAKVVRDVAPTMARNSAILLPLIAALEAAQWSLSQLRRGPMLGLGARAAIEAVSAAAAYQGTRPGWTRWLLRPWILRPLLALAPRFVPFDLEGFFRHHFTKVGDQTRAALETYRDQGQRSGLATAALEQLLATIQS